MEKNGTRLLEIRTVSPHEARADIHQDEGRQKDDTGPTSKRFTAQFYPGREGHSDEDQGERESRRECCGLQGKQTTAKQECNGDQPFEYAPEQAPPNRDAEIAARGDGRDDQRAGVR